MYNPNIPIKLYCTLYCRPPARYISRRYGVPCSETFEFLRHVVLPFVEVVPLDSEDLYKAEKYLVNYAFKPSDALHIATMEKTGATLIVSEDKDFDKVAWIKRVWPMSSSPQEL